VATAPRVIVALDMVGSRKKNESQAALRPCSATHGAPGDCTRAKSRRAPGCLCSARKSRGPVPSCSAWPTAECQALFVGHRCHGTPPWSRRHHFRKPPVSFGETLDAPPEVPRSSGLVALWREALLAQRALEGRISGYRDHPRLRCGGQRW